MPLTLGLLLCLVACAIMLMQVKHVQSPQLRGMMLSMLVLFSITIITVFAFVYFMSG